MGKVCCSATNSAQCDCLPSSISIAIPSWSYNGYSFTGQTLTAFKCCYYYYKANQNFHYYYAYRISPVIVGTQINGVCTSNVYFYYVFYQLPNDSQNTRPPCDVRQIAFITAAEKFPPSCVGNVTVRNISALTACGGISTDNLCYTDDFSLLTSLSAWGTIINCNSLGYNSTNQSDEFELPNPCELPSSIEVPFNYIFGTTLTFTIT